MKEGTKISSRGMGPRKRKGMISNRNGSDKKQWRRVPMSSTKNFLKNKISAKQFCEIEKMVDFDNVNQMTITLQKMYMELEKKRKNFEGLNQELVEQMESGMKWKSLDGQNAKIFSFFHYTPELFRVHDLDIKKIESGDKKALEMIPTLVLEETEWLNERLEKVKSLLSLSLNADDIRQTTYQMIQIITQHNTRGYATPNQKGAKKNRDMKNGKKIDSEKPKKVAKLESDSKPNGKNRLNTRETPGKSSKSRKPQTSRPTPQPVIETNNDSVPISSREETLPSNDSKPSSNEDVHSLQESSPETSPIKVEEEVYSQKPATEVLNDTSPTSHPHNHMQMYQEHSYHDHTPSMEQQPMYPPPPYGYPPQNQELYTQSPDQTQLYMQLGTPMFAFPQDTSMLQHQLFQNNQLIQSLRVENQDLRDRLYQMQKEFTKLKSTVESLCNQRSQ